MQSLAVETQQTCNRNLFKDSNSCYAYDMVQDDHGVSTADFNLNVNYESLEAEPENSFHSDDEELYFLHCTLMKLSLTLLNSAIEKFIFT